MVCEDYRIEEDMGWWHTARLQAPMGAAERSIR